MLMDKINLYLRFSILLLLISDNINETFIYLIVLLFSMTQKPKKLYRGFSIDISDLDEIIFKETLVPINSFSSNQTENQAENEVGVYMSTNPSVSDFYAIGPTPKIFTKEYYTVHARQSFIDLPSFGILLEIDTDGLDVRIPKICSAMRGHYNNGFIGDEYIADKIPSDFYHPIKFIIANSHYDSRKVTITFNGADDKELKEAISKAKETYETIRFELQKKADIINSLTDNERKDFFLVGKILRD